MKLPNWFRILWWFLLTAGLTWVLYRRYPDLVAGHAAVVDVLRLEERLAQARMSARPVKGLSRQYAEELIAEIRAGRSRGGARL